jgi:argininosuccinate synthase
LKIILAYSGGLDTSVLLKWLQEQYDAELIAVYIDLGQKEDKAAIKQKAIRVGAKKTYFVDARKEFIRDYFFPALRAGARYEDIYLMGTSLARPLIAKKLVEVAKKENAQYIAHGATGKGNDQVRFEVSIAALAPHLKVIAPWREWKFQGRADLLAYAKRHNIPVPVTASKPYSSDANLLHISYEGGVLEDPWNGPKDDMFQMTASPEKAPNQAEILTVGFKAGNPVSINGKTYSSEKIVEKLNQIAGRHGIGRVDVVESRYVGLKSRGVYESPGITVLHAAHRAVESITLDREEIYLKDSLMPMYARLAYFGYWFAPERQALQAMIDKIDSSATGEARLKLYKGNVTVQGRRSPVSLYQPKLASFEEAGGYRQSDATGFINLNALRLRIKSLVEKKGNK